MFIVHPMSKKSSNQVLMRPTRQTECSRVYYHVCLIILFGIYVTVTSRCAYIPKFTPDATKIIPSASALLECHKNPYRESLNTSLTDLLAMSNEWLASLPEHYAIARNENALIKHTRFQPFQPFGTCNQTCVGGACREDTSKIVCGIESLKKGCIVYSIGGNNDWRFELDLLERTPCEIHTFDCTGPHSRFIKPKNDRLYFHHICLAAESVNAPETCDNGHESICGPMMSIQHVQDMMNHTRIDLLKMDIEGFEWPILKSWPTLQEDDSAVLPYQILVEVHYISQFLQVGTPFSPQEHVKLQEHLLNMGYATIVRDDNPHCPHCTELSLVRIKCHARNPKQDQVSTPLV